MPTQKVIWNSQGSFTVVESLKAIGYEHATTSSQPNAKRNAREVTSDKEKIKDARHNLDQILHLKHNNKLQHSLYSKCPLYLFYSRISKLLSKRPSMLRGDWKMRYSFMTLHKFSRLRRKDSLMLDSSSIGYWPLMIFKFYECESYLVLAKCLSYSFMDIELLWNDNDTRWAMKWQCLSLIFYEMTMRILAIFPWKESYLLNFRNCCEMTMLIVEFPWNDNAYRWLSMNWQWWSSPFVCERNPIYWIATMLRWQC